jgi:cysteinyl-tRNA synthetase
MTIFLHDTLRAKKVAFEPLEPGQVTMYLCGPTVYNYAHIGNARPAVVFDLLTRLLRREYKLTFARNITDGTGDRQADRRDYRAIYQSV